MEQVPSRIKRVAYVSEGSKVTYVTDEGTTTLQYTFNMRPWGCKYAVVNHDVDSYVVNLYNLDIDVGTDEYRGFGVKFASPDAAIMYAVLKY
jgi:hypothetical protein